MYGKQLNGLYYIFAVWAVSCLSTYFPPITSKTTYRCLWLRWQYLYPLCLAICWQRDKVIYFTSISINTNNSKFVIFIYFHIYIFCCMTSYNITNITSNFISLLLLYPFVAPEKGCGRANWGRGDSDGSHPYKLVEVEMATLIFSERCRHTIYKLI